MCMCKSVKLAYFMSAWTELHKLVPVQIWRLQFSDLHAKDKILSLIIVYFKRVLIGCTLKQLLLFLDDEINYDACIDNASQHASFMHDHVLRNKQKNQ